MSLRVSIYSYSKLPMRGLGLIGLQVRPVKPFESVLIIQVHTNIPQDQLKIFLPFPDLNICSLFAEGTATFIAKVGGDPIPNVKWMKGKWRQITPGGRISVEHKGQEAKLEIREVTKSDSGQYRCVASSKHGEIECSTDMEVNKKEEAEGVGDFRAKLKK